MMATTHGFVGLALASVTVFVAPDLAVPAAVGGIFGGIFPDLDVAAEHRRTLHFPAYYSVLAVPALLVAAIATGPVTVAVACFLLAAAVHSASDVLGGTPEVRPWEPTSTRSVYLHARRRWLQARHWVRYDGAPEDFALAAAFAVPGIVLYDGVVAGLAVIGLVVSFAYTLFRKEIGRIVARWEG